jgi:serine kinase
MGCCCGKNKDENEKNKEEKKAKDSPSSPTVPLTQNKSPPISPSVEKSANEKSGKSTVSKKSKKGPLFKSDIDDTETEEKKLIEDEKLEKEMKHAVKGGESAYGKVIPKKGAGKKKSLPAINYNQSGLVDKESKEFQLVKEFLAAREHQLIDSIGSGNYAEVYKAFCSEKQRYVAVKVIDLKKANENYRVNFLPREIDILRRLKHPGIIKIYEISQTANKIFIIMEFAANGTIADWLRDKGSFSEETAWEMCTRILESLHYLHSMGIAHRDLKLENILITEKRYPKLSDFSYAIIVDEKNLLSQTFCGSLPYFSPEIMQRKPYNPLISDVWSLGVCFYVMLNDGLPFKINDERAMLNSQLASNWDFKKRVEAKLSPKVKAMVRKMLDPDTSRRATTQSLMKDQWITTPPKQSE